MTALTATDARKRVFNLLHDANAQHEIFHIRYRNGDAVLMSKKDIQKLTPKLRDKLKDILRDKVATCPYSGKPLTGDLKGVHSTRLSYKDRVVYSIHDDELVVLVIQVKTHDRD